MAAHQAPPSLGFSKQEHWSGLPFPSPMHESEKWKWSRSVVSDSSRPHGLQPTRLLHPWDFPGKSTGVGCHHLLGEWISGGWDSVSQNKFIFLPWNIFCSVLFSDTDLPKIIVLAFVRDEFHCVLPPHLTRKEEAEGWSRQALSPWLTHLLSGPVCTWPPRNSKHTPNPFVTAHNWAYVHQWWDSVMFSGKLSSESGFPWKDFYCGEKWMPAAGVQMVNQYTQQVFRG